MNENELRALIRERIGAGILPRGPGEKTFGGRGRNLPCDCCGRNIARHQIEYEVEFSSPHGAPARTLVAHLECHRLWWDESGAAEAQAGSAAAGEPIWDIAQRLS